MRGQSQRVPGKNRRPLGGRPLFHHILGTLTAVPDIGTVVVNSDDPGLLDDVQAAFPGIVPQNRPVALSAPDTPMNAVLMDAVARLPDADGLILQTHATSPFLSAGTITAGIAALRAAWPGYDSLMAVTRRQIRLWDDRGRPLNHDPDRLLPTQDLAPVFEENSCLYLFTAETLRTRANRIGARPLLWATPTLDSLDIDDEDDFVLAEALCGHKRRAGPGLAE
ncbi:cytidylyltransferase domain-containing protein [Roseospira visakhapatnamensis]|uniref:CMP-N-acetylneuraminic acid synthetase n=1 Tax=Roseospira visakhapatnamensis TaxID=390880 RepID=A0A7W6RGK0_9PROT|nr:acylneuraminate cytidylyltransferase family protein [Roseospira visakhapatnamensis]MBB4267644.1 CMP-N-acetylneuraminic acid synthetase [Roseospira visakhapatnamensis]